MPLLGSEAELERRLETMVKVMGGLSIKLGFEGWPDRIYAFPKGEVLFIELKRPGGVRSELQKHRMQELVSHRQHAYFIESLPEFWKVVLRVFPLMSLDLKERLREYVDIYS